MKATEDLATEEVAAEYAEVRFGVRVFARLILSADRESIVGDLIEDAEYRGLRGARRACWLASECAAIAAGLSVQRVRSWFVLPPVREVAAGLVVDGRGVLRGDVAGIVVRAVAFCASVATIALAVELLVRTLMTAAGL